jgi:DNA-binding IclR family transcriptional regulator
VEKGNGGNISVPAVKHALTILELLAHSKRGLNISEVGRKAALPKSSTYRLLATLENMSCVQKDAHTGRYHFGMKLVALGRAALANIELRDDARPFLLALMRQTGLTVHLSVLETGQAIIIDRIEGTGVVQVGTWVGRAIDLNCTAAGKSLVAFLPKDDLDRQIKGKSFVRHNHKTIVTLSRLRDNLAKVRELGYSVDDEEEEIGMRCVGAPLFDSRGRVLAAISAVGTTDQIPSERVEEVGLTLVQFAAAISTRISSPPRIETPKV